MEVQKFGEPHISIEELQVEWKGIVSMQDISLPLVEGVKEVIESLSKKHLLVINTASPKDAVETFLAKNNLHCFSGVYGSEASRSKVDKFTTIFANHNCEARECLFVTDTVGDVVESQMVGVETILVSWGYQSVELFDKVKPHVLGVAHKPEDILVLVPSDVSH